MTRFKAQSKIFRLIVLSDDVEQECKPFSVHRCFLGARRIGQIEPSGHVVICFEYYEFFSIRVSNVVLS